MSKHTPGPWEASKSESENEFWSIAHPGDERRVIGFLSLNPENGELEANARLMAAAPDLLNALQVLFDDYKGLADSTDAGFWRLEDKPAGKQAMAALAKARGES